MIPLETYKHMINSTDDCDELIELVKKITLQRNQVRRNIMKDISKNKSVNLQDALDDLLKGKRNKINDIVAYSQSDEFKEQVKSKQKNDQLLIEYQQLIDMGNNKARDLIWNSRNDD